MRTFLALILTAGAIMAQEAAPAVVDIKAFDTDKNGAFSKEEIAAIKDEAGKAAVLALDADKSGDVSAEEATPKH